MTLNPTPVSASSNSIQLKPKLQQEVRPEKFKAQFTGYLAKEKPHTLHKESSKEMPEEETNEDSQEEPTEEILTSESSLLYSGPFNARQEQQPVKSALNDSEQPLVEVDKLLNSSEPVFAAQVADESEKIDAFDQKEASMLDNQKAQIIKNGDNLLAEESDPSEANQVLVTVKENKLGGTILPTGRFLTEEWKNERMGITQLIAEPVQPIELSGTISDNEQLQQPKSDIIESKLGGLAELNSNEKLLKNPISFMKDLESTEQSIQIAEVDQQGQPIQQQSMVEALAIKQSSVVESVKQASIQLVSEVIIQEAESLLSGKKSIAHVTLSPEKMGEVRITVELIDNVLMTKIVVDNVETRELLTSGMNRLTDNLDRQNIRLGELTIQLNEHATADSASQERQGEEQKRTFGQKQAKISDNEIKTLKSEGKIDTGRLSILV